ncbi:hypothetical Protein psc1_04350 [Candidatus Phytoplasma solani]
MQKNIIRKEEFLVSYIIKLKNFFYFCHCWQIIYSDIFLRKGI